MEFCPKCGSILMMKKTKFGCPRCNYVAKGTVKLTTSETVNERVHIGVVSEKDSGVHPITDFDCESDKCKNKKAYFWIRQMRAGDEPESKFYKCTKCDKVVRVDD